MNLHAIVGPIVAVISPKIVGTVYVSAGSVADASFKRTPQFTAFPGVAMDVQALTGRELARMDALNIQGVLRSVYLNGNIEGLDRPAGKGGDILAFSVQPYGVSYWLVTQVLETWDTAGWCKVAVTLQNGVPAGIGS